MLANAMEVAQTSLDDLWALTTSVAVTCYIATTTCLLYILDFDHELPGNEQVGIVVIFLAFSVILACIYMQMLKKFRTCKNIFKEKQLVEKQLEEPNVGCSADSIGEEKEIDAFKSSLRFSPCVEGNSFPVQFQEEFSYRCDSSTSAPNTFAHESLSETDLKCAASKNTNSTSFKDTDEIADILHNCVKDLGDVIERVRLLNHAYYETFEDTSITKENSTTTVGSGDIIEHVKLLNHAYDETIEDTAITKENSTTTVGSGDVIEHVKLLNHAHVETIEDTAITKENSTTTVGSSDDIEHMKLLNHAHVETIEDTAVAIEHSMTTVEGRNSNSKFMDEEKSLQCKLQSTDDLEKLTDTSENTCSIHPDMSQNLNVQKPIKNSKINSHNRNPGRLGFSKILGENLCSYVLNVPEGATQEFLSKPGITVTSGPGPFLITIPSYEHQLHSAINPKPELDMGKKKISIRFYKTKPPVTPTVDPELSVKSRIPKLPMRPYVGKITMSQFMCQRANSKERYETLILSNSEPIISKNLPTISKKTPVISVNELMNSMNESLITDLAKPSISINEPLISKFEQADYKKFADALKDCADYCSLHSAILRQRLQRPRIAPFPKWESYTYPES